MFSYYRRDWSVSHPSKTRDCWCISQLWLDSDNSDSSKFFFFPEHVLASVLVLLLKYSYKFLIAILVCPSKVFRKLITHSILFFHYFAFQLSYMKRGFINSLVHTPTCYLACLIFLTDWKRLGTRIVLVRGKLITNMKDKKVTQKMLQSASVNWLFSRVSVSQTVAWETSVADSHTYSLQKAQECPQHSEIIAIIIQKHSKTQRTLAQGCTILNKCSLIIENTQNVTEIG